MTKPRSDHLYFDHAATTPVSQSVLEAMLPYFSTEFGNPSSVHRAGQAARKALEESRERVAEAVGADPRGVIFTSGATEADNMAVFGALAANPGGLVVGATEHPAVLSAAKRLAAEGRDVRYARPRADGEVTIEAVSEAMDAQQASGGTALVAVMHVNNETGVICEPRPLAELAHSRSALFLCDSVQALGTEPVDLEQSGADFLALSAHKVHGPKGAGALVVKRGLEVPPLLAGGEQERGFRPGTHNLPAIVGFGVAVQEAVAEQVPERLRLMALQRLFETSLFGLSGVSINGSGARRSVKHTSLAVEGVYGETVLMLLDEEGVLVSAGSACAAGSLDPSHVLIAMGLSRVQAKASLRFSFGKLTDEAAVRLAVQKLSAVIERARSRTLG